LLAQSLAWQVSPEAGSNDTAGAVSSLNLAPDYTKAALFATDSLLRALCLEDVRHSLAEVKVYIILAVNAIDLNQRSLVQHRAHAALVRDKRALGV
jgi:hypothetical protein